MGFGGFVYTDFGSAGGFNSYDYVRSLSVQPDGKIILGGTAWFYNNFYNEPKFAIARYRADLAVETQEVYGVRFQTLNLAPNPAGDFLDIRLPGISGAAVAAEVYNAQGQLMLRCEMAAGQALDVRGLTPGMYALKVLAGGRVYSGTFIKQ